MTLSDLDRVIAGLEGLVACCTLTSKAQVDAHNRASEALTILRSMREGAVEGYVDAKQLKPRAWVFVNFEQVIQDGDPSAPALLLLTPEDS